MRWNLLAILLVLAACTPAPGPAPMPPDASDAAPPRPAVDAAPPPVPSAACTTACAQLVGLCGPQLSTCAVTMQKLNDDRLMRAPNGAPITCARVAAAKTKADVVAAGIACP